MNNDISESSNDYSKWKVVMLQEELRKRNLPKYGKKALLITRLHESDLADNLQMEDEGSGDREGAVMDGRNHSPEKPTPVPPVSELHQQMKRDREERATIVLWKRPITTLYYFSLDLANKLQEYAHSLRQHWLAVLVSLLVIAALYTISQVQGSHQKLLAAMKSQALWCFYWVGLGILSSVGLGTGLHTFLLYLGPHIAQVTLAAYECMSVDFPEPPYPDDIVCPEELGSSMSIWTIIGKVRLEAFMWGAGTALGELPPYFMARAARLSGIEPDNPEYQEFEELMQQHDQRLRDQDWMTRAKFSVQKLVQKVGFLGIMACASIPNPLFDLAGITCGHFLVPFSTFFGATLIGKALIKMHIQKLFVITLFSEHHVDNLVSLVGKVPRVGSLLQTPFREYMAKQKQKLHRKPGNHVAADANWLSWIFEKVMIGMITYFVISIVNSMAQNYVKNMQHQQRQQAKKRYT